MPEHATIGAGDAGQVDMIDRYGGVEFGMYTQIGACNTPHIMALLAPNDGGLVHHVIVGLLVFRPDNDRNICHEREPR